MLFARVTVNFAIVVQLVRALVGNQGQTKGSAMKPNIHPDYMDCTVRCSCGNTWLTRATKSEMRVDLCDKCHPFYTGTQKLVDTGGRVQRFANKFGGAAAAQLARAAADKEARAKKAVEAAAAKKAAAEARAAEKAKRAADFAKKAEADAARKAAELAKAAADAAANIADAAANVAEKAEEKAAKVAEAVKEAVSE